MRRGEEMLAERSGMARAAEGQGAGASGDSK